MIEFIDTHAHVYEQEFDADRADVMRRAADAGVGRMLLPAIDSESYERMLAMCRDYPDRCFPMMGLHPTSVNDNPCWERDLALVRDYLAQNDRKFCGVGEIGLDYYWSSDFRDWQRAAFESQIEMALEFGLPIAVHVRDAWEDTVDTVSRFAGRGLRGVFHAFSGTAEDLNALRSSGDFLFGVGGTVTFKKSKTADVVREMELSEIVLETDCPYLTPVPHRGERNEPAYVSYVCSRIAEIKEMTIAEVAAATTANAERMFCCSSRAE